MNESPHELVVTLRRSPDDHELAAVAADWCEERGFAVLAARLRSPASRQEYLHAVWTLSSLFGLESTIFNRYTFVIGLPTVAIPAVDTVVIELTPLVAFRFRRLIVSAGERSDALSVSRIRFGLQDLLGSSPVPACVFSAEAGFDTFAWQASADVTIALTIENGARVDLEVQGCLLGDAVETGDYLPPWAR